MQTFHIHIKGIVQGVGFRPFVYKLALESKLVGWVNNTSTGVHIHINAIKEEAYLFFDRVLIEKPKFSVITEATIIEIPIKQYDQFNIVHSQEGNSTNLLVTPDYGMCEDCKNELYNAKNKRFRYPFITCTNCGPRYSIIQALPYDRPTTTMRPFKMCPTCQEEYDDPLNRRYYSQTNSCPDCAIELSIWQDGCFLPKGDEVNKIIKAWKLGKIVAIKGIGGLLLTCDATNRIAIKRLRKLKHRPTKPFAVMLPTLAYDLVADLEINPYAILEMHSERSPIVLVDLYDNQESISDIAYDEITGGLSKLGVMLPYTPLYELLLQAFGKPIVATSGNVSGDTIVFENAKAIKQLSSIADMIVLNNRDIVLAQDDSVVGYTKIENRKIIFRRSRGLAPSYLYKNSDKLQKKTILSLGAMLKSTFSLLHAENVFVSQYLGNTEGVAAQDNFTTTLEHLLKILRAKPDLIVVDKHPSYFTRQLGESLAQKHDVPILEVQHHQAHFMSVLAENDLLDKKVLGVIWDGTGLGEDGNIWGGEFFIYDKGAISRESHLAYFKFILGDKMVMEPRISALSITECHHYMKDKFSAEEWRIYNTLLAKKEDLKCSSAGRLFDAATSIILNIDKQNFEGEAPMHLESRASLYFRKNEVEISCTYLVEDSIPNNFPKFILTKLMEDKAKGLESDFLAAKFHITLAHYIYLKAKEIGVNKVAFSGGVFQNSWLVDLVYIFMENEFELYFHVDLSPNDEGVSFGQLIVAATESKNQINN